MISASAFKDYMNQSHPIHMHMADGREIIVPHGEHLALHPGGRMFIWWRPDGGWELFNLTMVTSIRVAHVEKGASKDRKKV
jgi:hypothetical protein